MGSIGCHQVRSPVGIHVQIEIMCVQEHASATFLVDKEGKVSKNSGDLEANIRKLLSEEHLKAPNK